MCLAFYILSIGVCTTRHWQTSGQLVQEINVCTVSINFNDFGCFDILVEVVSLTPYYKENVAGG